MRHRTCDDQIARRSTIVRAPHILHVVQVA
jgi:hypothetical protein